MTMFNWTGETITRVYIKVITIFTTEISTLSEVNIAIKGREKTTDNAHVNEWTWNMLTVGLNGIMDENILQFIVVCVHQGSYERIDTN